MIHISAVRGIELLQELEFRIADSQKRHPQSADRLRFAAMINHAIGIGCETLDDGSNFHIRLATFNRASDPLCENTLRLAIVSRCDTDMVHTFDMLTRLKGKSDRIGEAHGYADARIRIDPCFHSPRDPRPFLQRQAKLG